MRDPLGYRRPVGRLMDFLGEFLNEGPTPTARSQRRRPPKQRPRPARASDRRALSSDDIEYLLATDPAPAVEGYDLLFWADLEAVLVAVGQAERDRLPAWRVMRDFAHLRRMGWQPNGTGPLWEQVEDDIAAGRLPWANWAWRRRLRRALTWMAQAAERHPVLYELGQ